MPLLLRSPDPAEEQRIPDKTQDPVGHPRAKNRQPVHVRIVSVAILHDKLNAVAAGLVLQFGSDDTHGLLERTCEAKPASFIERNLSRAPLVPLQ
jgi:hypothetical protein